ncbi:hypothetical protein I316_01932 [Kwoniella heveanensis BCC8398]|uniref:Uncharacterized protein n=1 Tax=Kwoniella heveanensis BCC8398 TaxID=1296120 RepID=A0A1B9GYH8_9TREE|nr:hypothetical protein I316_01932 [Kwoniella heveanensis BCC8398]
MTAYAIEGDGTLTLISDNQSGAMRTNPYGTTVSAAPTHASHSAFRPNATATAHWQPAPRPSYGSTISTNVTQQSGVSVFAPSSIPTAPSYSTSSAMPLPPPPPPPPPLASAHSSTLPPCPPPPSPPPFDPSLAASSQRSRYAPQTGESSHIAPVSTYRGPPERSSFHPVPAPPAPVHQAGFSMAGSQVPSSAQSREITSGLYTGPSIPWAPERIVIGNGTDARFGWSVRSDHPDLNGSHTGGVIVLTGEQMTHQNPHALTQGNYELCAMRKDMEVWVSLDPDESVRAGIKVEDALRAQSNTESQVPRVKESTEFDGVYHGNRPEDWGNPAGYGVTSVPSRATKVNSFDGAIMPQGSAMLSNQPSGVFPHHPLPPPPPPPPPSHPSASASSHIVPRIRYVSFPDQDPATTWDGNEHDHEYGPQNSAQWTRVQSSQVHNGISLADAMSGINLGQQ